MLNLPESQKLILKNILPQGYDIDNWWLLIIIGLKQ